MAKKQLAVIRLLNHPGTLLLALVLSSMSVSWAGVSSDGSVFSDEMSDLTQWSTRYVGSPTGGTVTPSGNCYTLGGPRWDSRCNAEIYTSDAIDYGSRTQWAVEIRFRVNACKLSDSSVNRQVGLLIGAADTSTSISGIRDYCVTLLEHPANENWFSIGWGDMNGMLGGEPETLITDIPKFTFHSLVIHHKTDNNLDFYLNGVLRATRPAISHAGSQQAKRVFISDTSSFTTMNIDMDRFRIGGLVGSGATLASNGSVWQSEFKDLSGWGTNYVGEPDGCIASPMADFCNVNSKWLGGDSGSYTEIYTTAGFSYGALTEWATELRFRVNAFSTGEPLSTQSPNRQVGLLVGARSDSPGDSWSPTVDCSLLLLQGSDHSRFSLGWGKMNDDVSPPSVVAADLSRGTYYTVVLHHKSNNDIDIYVDGVYAATRPAIFDGEICRADRYFIADSAQVPSVNLDIDCLKVGAAIGGGQQVPQWSLSSSAVQSIYQNGVPHTDRRGNLRSTYSPSTSFIPLAVYSAYEGNVGGAIWTFAKFAGAGFNTVHLGPGYPASITVADSAASAGMQMIVYVPTDQQILDLRNHPATLAWLPLEEPGNTGWTYDQYVARTAQIKSLDSSHPVFMLDTAAIYDPAWLTWNTTGDITSHDNYPLNPMFDGTTRPSLSYYMGIPETVSLAVSANNESKPMWFAVQAFGHTIDNALFRIPSAQQLRCMVYTALVHGATGILYFVPDSPGSRAAWLLGISPDPLPYYYEHNPMIRATATADQVNQSRNLWMQAVSLNSEIEEIKSSILSPTANVTYEVYVDSNLAAISPTPVRTLLKKDPGGGYTLMVVNVDSVPQRVRVRFPGSQSLNANELFASGSQFSVTGDCLDFGCLAYDVRVFHVVGDSAEIPAASQLRVANTGAISTSKIVGWTSGLEYRQLAEFDISSYKDRPVSSALLKFDAAAIWSEGSVLDIDSVPSDLHIDSADFGSPSLGKLVHAAPNKGAYAVDVTEQVAVALVRAVPNPGSHPWGKGIQFRWSDSAGVWNTYGYTVSNPRLELQFGIPDADETTIAQAKQQAEGSAVSCTGVVTARFGDHFYIEMPDRSSGIRVNAPSAGRLDGEWVSVVGRAITLDSGERCIESNPYVVPVSGDGTVEPPCTSPVCCAAAERWCDMSPLPHLQPACGRLELRPSDRGR